MTTMDVVYHNVYGKRNRMIIDFERFFPCDKSWLDKLIKVVILGSDDPDLYLQQITEYVDSKYAQAVKTSKETPRAKNKKVERQYKACLDLLGGKYGQQHSDSNAG